MIISKKIWFYALTLIKKISSYFLQFDFDFCFDVIDTQKIGRTSLT